MRSESPEEAAICIEEMSEAWDETEGYLEWMLSEYSLWRRKRRRCCVIKNASNGRKRRGRNDRDVESAQERRCGMLCPATNRASNSIRSVPAPTPNLRFPRRLKQSLRRTPQ